MHKQFRLPNVSGSSLCLLKYCLVSITTAAQEIDKNFHSTKFPAFIKTQYPSNVHVFFDPLCTLE